MSRRARMTAVAGRAGRGKHAVEITIVGLVGPRSERSIINVEESLAGMDNDVGVEWISDPLEICKLGSLQAPSVYVNGTLRSSGRIPSVHEIRKWVDEELSEVAA